MMRNAITPTVAITLLIIIFHSNIIEVLGEIDKAIYQKIQTKDFSNFYKYSKEECSKNGGVWEEMGVFRKIEGCQYYSKDENKSCLSGYQCELGACVPPNYYDTITFGKCEKTLSHLGCFAFVHFGVVEQGYCAD